MVCTQELLLPAQSVAVQVRVMTEVLGQAPGAVLSVKVITGAGSQLSVAVALPVTLGSLGVLHWTVASGGQLITGAVVSTTLMVCTQIGRASCRERVWMSVVAAGLKKEAGVSDR